MRRPKWPFPAYSSLVCSSVKSPDRPANIITSASVMVRPQAMCSKPTVNSSKYMLRKYHSQAPLNIPLGKRSQVSYNLDCGGREIRMVLCPECAAEIDVDEGDVDEGDSLS